jgi:hypothetical protein
MFEPGEILKLDSCWRSFFLRDSLISYMKNGNISATGLPMR